MLNICGFGKPESSNRVHRLGVTRPLPSPPQSIAHRLHECFLPPGRMQKALDILDAFCIHTGMANHVRHLREELGLTQRDFAAEMGVVRSTVFRWENRRETLPRSVEILLAAVAEKHGIEWPPQLRAA